MIDIEYKDKLEERYYDLIDAEFNKYAIQNGLNCDYKSFAFIAKENNEVIGIITGHAYYKEVHISDLIVLEQYRNRRIGSKLIEAVEDYHKKQGFDNINLTTYEFQAPEFYKKCGFKIEYIRENKENPKLTKYYLIKYF